MSVKSTLQDVNPKVTAATAACAVVSLVIGLTEWLGGVDVPTTVEFPATVIATFLAGWWKSDTRGAHEA